jgi:hypothetical protein
MKAMLQATIAVALLFGLLIPTEAIADSQNVCAGAVPSGWIKVNDQWDPTKCGNPTSITYNVWTIERYNDKPKGTVMNACSDTPPSGWTRTDQQWNPTKCGHPTSNVKNIMTIKRLN